MSFKLSEIDECAIFGNFSDMRIRPELPKISFSRDGINYKVTDCRFLNKYGTYALTMCINYMANNDDAKEIEIVAEGADKDDLSAINDIVLGFDISASKRGKDGFNCSCSLISALERTEIDGKAMYHFKPNRDIAKAIYKYSHENEVKQLTIVDIAVIAIKDTMRRFDEWDLGGKET